MTLGFEESTLCPRCYHIWADDGEIRHWLGTMVWRPFSRIHEVARTNNDWRVTNAAIDKAFNQFMETQQ